MSNWWLVVFMVGAPGWLAAQPDSRGLARVSKQVEGHDRARITTQLGQVVVTRPVVHPQGIEFSRGEAGQRETVGWGSLSRVELRTNSAGRGALIGAATLAIAGLVAGATFAEPCPPATGFSIHVDCGWSAGDIALGAAGAAALGAGFGALIGLAIPRWRSVYEGAPVSRVRPLLTASPAQLRIGLTLRW